MLGQRKKRKTKRNIKSIKNTRNTNTRRGRRKERYFLLFISGTLFINLRCFALYILSMFCFCFFSRIFNCWLSIHFCRLLLTVVLSKRSLRSCYERRPYSLWSPNQMHLMLMKLVQWYHKNCSKVSDGVGNLLLIKRKFDWFWTKKKKATASIRWLPF